MVLQCECAGVCLTPPHPPSPPYYRKNFILISPENLLEYKQNSSRQPYAGILRDIRSCCYSCYSHFKPAGATKEHCVESIGIMEQFRVFKMFSFGHQHLLSHLSHSRNIFKNVKEHLHSSIEAMETDKQWDMIKSVIQLLATQR